MDCDTTLSVERLDGIEGSGVVRWHRHRLVVEAPVYLVGGEPMVGTVRVIHPWMVWADLSPAEQAKAHDALRDEYAAQCDLLRKQAELCLKEAKTAVERAIEAGATDTVDELLDVVRQFNVLQSKRKAA